MLLITIIIFLSSSPQQILICRVVLRHKIFKTGFTTKPMGEGTGIGLTISREIIEDQHGGEIGFDSVVGQGTTFYFVIPARQPRKE